MNEISQLVAEAELGEEARKFMQSDLYRVMVGLAQQEVDSAIDELQRVSPKDTEKIIELQLKIRFGRNFEAWLKDLVEDGDNAIAIFQQERAA